eukprot:NODE_936_length_1752_cov_35.375385_g772_i1.p1 GENE.NODE_936_length_1752_cov_35.375385_g772_i1~~NODE_936_length_1752_cov_35.375385_g772_i1.p1  ORF type:complete len:535 (+),score=148.08 NODE_936_length_1752_cov_35.375385_g772_i1:17-1621(+)
MGAPHKSKEPLNAPRATQDRACSPHSPHPPATRALYDELSHVYQQLRIAERNQHKMLRVGNELRQLEGEVSLKNERIRHLQTDLEDTREVLATLQGHNTLMSERVCELERMNDTQKKEHQRLMEREHTRAHSLQQEIVCLMDQLEHAEARQHAAENQLKLQTNDMHELSRQVDANGAQLERLRHQQLADRQQWQTQLATAKKSQHHLQSHLTTIHSLLTGAAVSPPSGPLTEELHQIYTRLASHLSSLQSLSEQSHANRRSPEHSRVTVSCVKRVSVDGEGRLERLQAEVTQLREADERYRFELSKANVELQHMQREVELGQRKIAELLRQIDQMAQTDLMGAKEAQFNRMAAELESLRQFDMRRQAQMCALIVENQTNDRRDAQASSAIAALQAEITHLASQLQKERSVVEDLESQFASPSCNSNDTSLLLCAPHTSLAETPLVWSMYRVEVGMMDDVAGREHNVVLVKHVAPAGPGAKAGLQVGDILLRFDGRLISTVEQLEAVVQYVPLGATVRVEVARQGRQMDLFMSLN